MGKRIEYIDAAKGLAMILVVIGHCHWKGHLAGSLIYSFHMPLFFIISGFFLKQLTLRKSVIRSAVNYLRPYLITCCILLAISLVATSIKGADLLEDLWKCVKTAFYGGKCPGCKGHFIGPMWFLLGLFWAVITYSFLRNRMREPYRAVCVWVLLFAAILSYKVWQLPLCLQSGMAAVVYIWIGDLIRTHDLLRKFGELKPVYKVCFLLFWLLSAHFLGAMDLAKCNYGYGLRIPASVIATLLFIDALRMAHVKGGWLGRQTLYLLCGHQVGYFLICQFHLGLRDLPYLPVLNFLIEFGAFMSTTLLVAFVMWKLSLFEKRR